MLCPPRPPGATPTPAVVPVPDDASQAAPSPPRAVSARPRPIRSGRRRVRTGSRAGRPTVGGTTAPDDVSPAELFGALSCFMPRSPSSCLRPRHRARSRLVPAEPLVATQWHILPAVRLMPPPPRRRFPPVLGRLLRGVASPGTPAAALQRAQCRDARPPPGRSGLGLVRRASAGAGAGGPQGG